LKSLTFLNSLEELQIYGHELIDLTGIETLINLKRLSVFFKSKIVNLEPLRNLLNLEVIRIQSKDLSNIDAIEDLPNLKIVGLKSEDTNCMSKFNRLLIDKGWKLPSYW
jgi:Leucine-rich repeat (LRR) protein